MQAGDIVFVRGKTLMSKLIRFFDKGEFSHVAMAVSPNLIIEAQYGTKVRIVPFRFNYEDCEIVDLGLTEEQRKQIQRNANKYVGKRYDYLQAIGLALKRGIDNQNAYICTEIIHEMLGCVGYECCPNDMKPNELYRYLKGGD